jgi:hypothetical protein
MNKEVYKCPECQRLTSTKHEIFFGTSARKISIKYSLQVPLCLVCHTVAHTRELLNGYSPLLECRTKDGLNKVMIQKRLCGHLGIDRDKVSLAVNTNDYDYLEKIKPVCEGAIDMMRVF